MESFHRTRGSALAPAVQAELSAGSQALMGLHGKPGGILWRNRCQGGLGHGHTWKERKERLCPSPKQSYGERSWRQKVKRCSCEQQGPRSAGWGQGWSRAEHIRASPLEQGELQNHRKSDMWISSPHSLTLEVSNAPMLTHQSPAPPFALTLVSPHAASLEHFSSTQNKLRGFTAL